MSSRIGLEPDVKEIRLSPGENATIQLTVTNYSSVVDAFDLTVNNLEPSWYTLVPEHVSLFPRAEATVQLQIKPPAMATTLAGAYPFQILAVSRDSPTETTAIVIQFYVAGASELALAIEPQRIVARKGNYTLRLTNGGNIERPVALHPSDPDALLAFAFGKARTGSIADTARKRAGADVAVARSVSNSGATPVTLPSAVETNWSEPNATDAQGLLEMTMPPASVVEIPLLAQTKRRIWFGRQRDLRFEIKATPPGVEWEEKDAKIISGELVYNPYLAAWSALPLLLRRLAMIALVLLILGLLLFLLFRTPPGVAQTNGAPTPGGLTSAQLTATANAVASQTAAAMATANASATAAAAAAQATAGAAAQATAAANATAAAVATALANGTQVPDAGGTSASLTATASAASVPGSKSPKIEKFDLEFAPDGSTVAKWQVSNALTVTLNGAKVDPIGSQVVDTTTNQSLVLIAANDKGQISQSTGVFLTLPPEIKSFVADPAGAVCSGCEVTLSWTTVSAEQVTIDDTPVPDSDRNAGSIKIKPTQGSDYVLTARSAIGQVQSSVIVPVVTGTPKVTPAKP